MARVDISEVDRLAVGESEPFLVVSEKESWLSGFKVVEFQVRYFFSTLSDHQVLTAFVHSVSAITGTVLPNDISN